MILAYRWNIVLRTGIMIKYTHVTEFSMGLTKNGPDMLIIKGETLIDQLPKPVHHKYPLKDLLTTYIEYAEVLPD